MSLLSRLNSRFGRYGIPHLTIALIVGQVLIYVAAHVDTGENGLDIVERVQLYPAKVLAGEVWRLVTFVFVPPGKNVIFAFIFWYLFYLMGSTLEVVWGAFRYNLFLAIGYVAVIAAAFAGYYFADPGGPELPASNWFVQGTVFLAFARLYPDFTMLLYFVLPVKIRWLALITWIIYAVTFITGGWMDRAMIAAAVLNYWLFFGYDIWDSVKHGHRRMQRQSKSIRSPSKLVHVCRVCGITSEQALQMQFRYCSKCYGEACYCQDHLRDHEHVPTPATVVAGDGDG